jgi:hypothetical protein
MRSTEGLSPERIAKRQQADADVKAIGAIADRLRALRRSEFVGLESLDGFEAQQIRDAATLLGAPASDVVVANVHNTEEAAAIRETCVNPLGLHLLVSGDGDLEWTLTRVVHAGLLGVEPFVIDDENNGLWCTRDVAEKVMLKDFDRTLIVIQLLQIRAGNPDMVDWAKFLASSDADFNHDFYGIREPRETPAG